MKRAWRRGLVVLVVVTSVAAAACGGDGQTGSGGGTPSGGTASTVVAAGQDAPTGPGTPEPVPLAETTEVVVSYAGAYEDYATAILADELGEFEKENLDVSFAVLPPADGVVQLAQRRVDLLVTGVSVVTLNAMAQGTPVRIVGNIHSGAIPAGEGLWVRNELFEDPDPVTVDAGAVETATADDVDVDEVPGMKIVTGPGGITGGVSVFVERWLASVGHSVADVEMLSMGSSDALVALKSGAIDAAYLPTPIWTQMDGQDFARQVDIGEGAPVTAFLMNQDFMADEPEVARAIVRALVRTARTHLDGDYHADPEVMAALEEPLGIPAGDIAAGDPKEFVDLTFDPAFIEEAQELWLGLDEEVLSYDEPLTVEDVADTSIVEVVKAGG